MTFRRSFVIAAAVATLASLVGPGGPAGAVACPPFDPNEAADGKVSPGSMSPYIGEGIFNRNGNSQNAFADLAPGEADVSFAIYENTANVSKNIVVAANLVGDTGSYVVKITNFERDKDFTAKLLSPSGRTFRNVAGDGTIPDLRVRIKLRNDASPNAELTVRFRGSFDAASKCADTVKLGDIEL